MVLLPIIEINGLTLHADYFTTAFSYDYSLNQYNSGIGFMAMVDQAGTAGMKSSQFNFLYSYKWSISNSWIVSAGLNFGYAFRSVDWNKLVFGDQLQFDADGTTPSDDPALYNLEHGQVLRL
ncbi:MAG: type IX secretion system membrane protein PorP/SprF [Cytophagales bacterium]|nr:type IX secretion system membrane protein PorP/SprF [Cytophagales bacterium]